MTDTLNNEDFLSFTTEIVSAHVAHNAVTPTELPELIRNVYNTLSSLGGNNVVEKEATKPVPAVPVKKSVTPDYVICLEDGKKLKTLKRHLMSAYGMTLQEYKLRWNLPDDYPCVAPNYAVRRSTLAKKIGLGRKK